MSFRLKGSPKRTTNLAIQGLVEGGKFDGCRYTFDHFSAVRRGEAVSVRVHLIINRQGWPFPEDVILKASDFRRLAPVAGARSRRIDALPLIQEVLQAAG